MDNPRITSAGTGNNSQSNNQAQTANRSMNQKTNPGQTTRSVGQMSNYGTIRGALELREGDIVKGEVSDLRNNEITITLENNTVIKGQIPDSSQLSIGQTGAFRLNTVSPKGLILEVIPNSYTESELTLINKALEEASLPATTRNQSAVKALMDNLLPINKQAIQLLMQQAYDYGTEDMESLAIMNKNHMKLNQDSVIQFSQFRNGQNQLLSQIQEFTQELPELLDILSHNGPSDIVSQFGQQLLSIATPKNLQYSTQSYITPTLSMLSPSQQVEVKNLLSETPLEDTTLVQLTSGKITLRDVLTLIQNASLEGTLKLTTPCSQEELGGKIQEVLLALEPTTNKVLLPSADSFHSVVVLPEAFEDIAPAPASTSEKETPDETSLSSFAGKLFHNISETAKTSIQTINTLLNQENQEANPVSNTPAVLDEIISIMEKSGREQDTLSTYLSPLQREELVKQLSQFSIPLELAEKVLKGDVSTLEVMYGIKDSMNQTSSKSIKDLFQTTGFQNLFTKTLLSQWTITPNQLAQKGKTSSFYQNMEQQLTQFENLIKNTLSGQDSMQLTGEAHTMKSNVDFMKTLNEAFPFMQLPLKLQSQDAHGELYVYTQKEKLKRNPDKISVLLHLDMESLGTVDIKLDKNQNNVQGKFYLDNKPSIQLLTKNASMLEMALSEKGYTSRIEIQSKEKEQDLVQEFINGKITPTNTGEMKRFSFDIRA